MGNFNGAVYAMYQTRPDGTGFVRGVSYVNRDGAARVIEGLRKSRPGITYQICSANYVAGSDRNFYCAVHLPWLDRPMEYPARDGIHDGQEYRLDVQQLVDAIGYSIDKSLDK